MGLERARECKALLVDLGEEGFCSGDAEDSACGLGDIMGGCRGLGTQVPAITVNGGGPVRLALGVYQVHLVLVYISRLHFSSTFFLVYIFLPRLQFSFAFF